MVPDASVVVAALVDAGPVGLWAESVLREGGLAAPHLMVVEVANILRRATAAGRISTDVGALTHADLVGLRVELFPYAFFAARVWDLRANITAYDAWYVAVAESLDADLVTSDRRLSKAAGFACRLVVVTTSPSRRPEGTSPRPGPSTQTHLWTVARGVESRVQGAGGTPSVLAIPSPGVTKPGGTLHRLERPCRSPASYPAACSPC